MERGDGRIWTLNSELFTLRSERFSILLVIVYMKRLLSPEVRGILGLVAVIVGVGTILAASTGKLEQWFGIAIFAGPSAYDKIVFVSDRSGTDDIYLMDPDGSNQTRLTEKAHVYSMPAISPSGRRIVYVGRFQNQDQVFSVSPKGGTPDRLTSATGPKKLPCFSPDGARLSFIVGGKVYTAEPNGDGLEPVLPTEVEIHQAMTDPLMRNQTPAYTDYAWQRNSMGMMGVTKDPGRNDLLVYLSKPDGEPAPIPLRAVVDQLLRDTGMAAKQILPSEFLSVTGLGWAADTDTLAVTASAGKRSFLLVLAIEDGKPRIVGFRPLDGQEASRPGLSPDGTKIALAVKSLDNKAASGMLVLDLNTGSGQIVVGGVFENPVYSPDGEKILATSIGEGDTRDVVIIDPSDGSVKPLTTDGHSFNAIWTPTAPK